MELFSSIIFIVVLIMSVVIHEISHGYAALWLGDTTARDQGRLTLNPLRHLDWVGSVIVPILLIVIRSPFLIGWAKPVPFNHYNFKRHRRWGRAYVALAGPLVNIIIALIFGVLIRFAPQLGIDSPLFMMIVPMIVLMNLVLAFFNLIPVPPLDGHHVVEVAFPKFAKTVYGALRGPLSFIIYIIAFIIIWRIFEPAIYGLYKVIVGTPFFGF